MSYFPCQPLKVVTEIQLYVLGRAFLQEATVDVN